MGLQEIGLCQCHRLIDDLLIHNGLAVGEHHRGPVGPNVQRVVVTVERTPVDLIYNKSKHSDLHTSNLTVAGIPPTVDLAETRSQWHTRNLHQKRCWGQSKRTLSGRRDHKSNHTCSDGAPYRTASETPNLSTAKKSTQSGIEVGAMVDCSVGTGVGYWDGMEVGNAVGASVGTSDGKDEVSLHFSELGANIAPATNIDRSSPCLWMTEKPWH